MPPMKNEPLLYRFGFVCVAAEEFPPGEPWKELRSVWEMADIRDFLVLSHPETPVAAVSDSALLIGHAFAAGESRPVRELLGTALSADSDSALHETLDVLSGRFALVTSRWGGRVYHDAMGSRSVFYRSGQPPCAASHGWLVADLFGAAIDPLAEEISRQPEYASRRVAYLPGDLSVHEGVLALAPNNYYDISAGRSARYWPRTPRRKATLDEFHSCMDTYLGGFAAYLSGRFTPVLGVTPGVDSRAIIAAFRRHNVPMEYVTWTGRAMPEEDVPAARDMGAYLGGRHAFMRIEEGSQESGEFQDISGSAVKNAGHFSEGTDIPACMYQRFEDRGDLAFVRGYGGEVMLGFYRIGDRPRIEALSTGDLVNTYGMGMKKPLSEKFVKLASEAVERFMARADYERLPEFGYDLNDLYYWESRMGMWGSSLHNEMDAAMLSMPGFNNRRLFEAAFGLEPEERLTNELLLGVARRHDERLASFPVNPSKQRKAGKARQSEDGSPTEKRLRERLEAQRERNKALAEKLREREAEIGRIKQSRSWRYTRLLRRIMLAARSRMPRRRRGGT